MNNTICNNNLKEPNFYAGFSLDKVNVENSSSGGIFYELCKWIIKENGAVYGAALVSATEVKHMRADTLEEVQKFRRSKYLKSRMNNCFLQAKEDLEKDKMVLFSGVPCQIAALYRYLNKEYKNLYTVEVACHGVPLTHVLKKYVDAKSAGVHGRLTSICFRDKSKGWKHTCYREYYEDGHEELVWNSLHPVHLLYRNGVNVEERCISCEYAQLPRCADMTLADFWQYKGEMLEKSNDRGLSLIAVNNEKGDFMFKTIQGSLCYEEASCEMALESCHHMHKAPLIGRGYKAFQCLLEKMDILLALDICSRFGDVVLANELYKTSILDKDFVIKVLEEDSQEIVYIVDEEDVLKGIVTFGAFVQAYVKGEEWVNYNFGKVIFSENCVNDIREVFERSNKILRVPVLDEEGKLLFEVRRQFGGNGRNDARKAILSQLDILRLQ